MGRLNANKALRVLAFRAVRPDSVIGHLCCGLVLRGMRKVFLRHDSDPVQLICYITFAEHAATPKFVRNACTFPFSRVKWRVMFIGRELEQSARHFITILHGGTQADGLELYRSGRVEMVKETARNVYEVNLRGHDGDLETVSLMRDSEGWIADCTCEVGEDCEHCCAAMYALLLGNEKQFKKGPVAPSAHKDTFHAKTITFANRPLTQLESDAAKAVDKLFQDHRDAYGVLQSLVDQAAGIPSRGWRYATVELWPELRPKTIDEAWMLIASYFRRNKMPLLPVFMGMTDWEAVDDFVGNWERQQKVRDWSHRLFSESGRLDRVADVSHELQLRVNQTAIKLYWRKDSAGEFKGMPESSFRQLASAAYAGTLPLKDVHLDLWRSFFTGYDSKAQMSFDEHEKDVSRVLNNVLRDSRFADCVCGPTGIPLIRAGRKLVWQVDVVEKKRVDYFFTLALSEGEAVPPALITVDGEPALYVTASEIFETPPLGGLDAKDTFSVPAEAIESEPGVALFERLKVEPPPRLAKRVKVVQTRAVLKCRLEKNGFGDGEMLIVNAYAERDGERVEQFTRDGWHATKVTTKLAASDLIVRNDRRPLAAVPDAILALKATWSAYGVEAWQKPTGKKFAEHFSEWITGLSPTLTLELDPMLESLRGPAIAARVKLEVEESDIDWFDVRIALDVADTTLTKAELKALLDARGGFVRLGEKGWRRLSFSLSPEDEEQFAELGLNARDFDGGPQKLHALQLAGRAKTMLPDHTVRAILLRAEEIKTRVTPPVPAGLKATLRPYQEEGFHFLAYLSTNRFGGILADDMGLGKTVQTLAWLLWLRDREVEEPAKKSKKPQPTRDTPALVVAPKSVVDNWRTEAARFAPSLRVTILGKGGCDASALDEARKNSDIVVMNYVHLRLLEKEASNVPWRAVILDEAQAIKNPDSATAKAAWALNSPHRIALSGTPIENRLLDLWSIMSFTMPGVLGLRGAFGKTYDQRADPFARRRLAARTRPFILRRTKGEVAKDLPDRIEEDIICEMDSVQATLYRAELKRARMALLKLTTKADLDKARFNILTSLLRLRQICCHPGLVSEKADKAESAKMNALIDLIEPLAAEGHKVLVFSQFVEMLSRIEVELATRLGDTCKLFKLTGQTEDRGELVQSFQTHEGAATFLISLRAGGFGLNLTAASYVVLFDPWWNPAVENQAIDRTHRIGQVNKVIAYRLVVKDSIEEKIRGLQKQKSALAADILGEENFARALTMDDFQFLLSE